MKNNFMKKRGVIDNFTLIVITALVSFVILFIFVYNAFASIDSDYDACHQSVIQRSTFNFGPGEPGREYIPLNCRTQKLCLQANKGEGCETSGVVSTKDNAVKKIGISSKPQKSKGEIISQIADSMYRCHSMMGEGKLNFMPHSLKEGNYCIVCTKIGVDDKIKNTKSAPKITQEELYNYLDEREDNKGDSYLKQIYKVDKLDDLKLYSDQTGEKILGDDRFKISDLKSNSIDLNSGSYAIVVQQIPKGTASSFTWATVSGVGTTVGAGYGLAWIASVTGLAVTLTGVGFVVVAGVVVGTAVFTYSGANDDYEYAAPTVVPYDADTLKALKCTDLEGAP
ncbi:hypothetical protein COU57_03750 [Candidatus Pacearchaeota archaeon CG10_big_fil_rev_8_21_14_0_10_32_14]|nr:MAG: hypothetical protein COU57_03750 [Candidatus Pacearchaeota archaeon CG10_big_fil_rev_8_21_14_0_10_32_14]